MDDHMDHTWKSKKEYYETGVIHWIKNKKKIKKTFFTLGMNRVLLTL